MPHDYLKVVRLIISHSKNLDMAHDHIQSFLYNITQHGQTFVPGQESKQSRAQRVTRTIQAVDYQFANPSAAQHQQQGQGDRQSAQSSATGAALNGVGQQFPGYTRQ